MDGQILSAPTEESGFIRVSPENRKMPSENGRFSLFLSMCPRRNVDNHRVTKTENGSDLIKNGPPFL